MNNLVRYVDNLDEVLKMVENNSNYFDNFGDIYIMKELKGHLDTIYFEINKIKELVSDMNSNDYAGLETGANS